MSTTIRPTTSGKNPYWIDKHRYYELKHFCLQYPSWRKARLYLDGIQKKSMNESVAAGTKTDLTADRAEAMIFYGERMAMVENAANDADSELAHYILRGVTEGLSYEYLKSKLEIPCCRDTYYEAYRKFFWILSRERQ